MAKTTLVWWQADCIFYTDKEKTPSKSIRKTVKGDEVVATKVHAHSYLTTKEGMKMIPGLENVAKKSFEINVQDLMRQKKYHDYDIESEGLEAKTAK